MRTLSYIAEAVKWKCHAESIPLILSLITMQINIFITATGKISFFTSRIWKSQLLSIWIVFLYCNIKSTITIIAIIINLIDAEWPIVLSLMNEHNKPIIIQHRAWDTFCMFILILFCGSFTSGAKLLLQY